MDIWNWVEKLQDDLGEAGQAHHQKPVGSVMAVSFTLDGQAMLEFPERLKDLFDLSKVIDPDRPSIKQQS